jgi:hypothetical protein
MEHLAGDLAAGRVLHFLQVVDDGDVTNMGRCGIERATDLDRLLAARMAQDRECSRRRDGRTAEFPAG